MVEQQCTLNHIPGVNRCLSILYAYKHQMSNMTRLSAKKVGVGVALFRPSASKRNKCTPRQAPVIACFLKCNQAATQ